MTIQTAKEIAEAHNNWLAYMYLRDKYSNFLEMLPVYKGGGR